MSLQVWLPLTGNLENKGLSDIKFSNTGSSTITIDTKGKIGDCYQRATKLTDGRITSDKQINLDNDFSIFCWAYVTSSVGSTANGLVSNHDHATSTGASLNIKHISDSDYRICCSTGTGGSRTYDKYYGTTNIKDEWHHLGLTYKKSESKLQLFVDGNVEYTLLNYQNASKSDYIILFDWSTSYLSNTFKPGAKLNDVRIYDHVLSKKEIKEISKALVVHYKLNNFDNVIEYDCSGYGYNGRYNGAFTFDATSPKYNTSTIFNGTNNYIMGQTLGQPACQNISISAWIKTAAQSNNGCLITSYEQGGAGIHSTQGGSSIVFQIFANGAYKGVSTTITVGEWTHIVGTYDGANLKIYKNGELKNTISYAGGNITYNSNTPWAIGCNPQPNGASGGEYYKGNLSDVRIYATALNDADIKELSKVFTSIDNKNNLFSSQFNEEDNINTKIRKNGITASSTIEEGTGNSILPVSLEGLLTESGDKITVLSEVNDGQGNNANVKFYKNKIVVGNHCLNEF